MTNESVIELLEGLLTKLDTDSDEATVSEACSFDCGWNDGAARMHRKAEERIRGLIDELKENQ